MKKHFVDLHIHSTFSDGQMSIAEIVDYYGQKKFSAIAITDHLTDTDTLTGKVTRKLNLSLNEDTIDQYLTTLQFEARRALQKYNMHLISGLEITLNSWSREKGAHLVLLNIDQYVNPNQSVEQLLLKNRKYFSIAAHPLWEQAYEFKTTYLWENRVQLAPLFDAWECATGQHFSKEVYLSGYPVLASSDFHSSKKTDSWKSLVYSNEFCPETLFHLIKSKKVEPVWM